MVSGTVVVNVVGSVVVVLVVSAVLVVVLVCSVVAVDAVVAAVVVTWPEIGVPSSTKIVFVFQLAVAISRIPSPLKSTTIIPVAP